MPMILITALFTDILPISPTNYLPWSEGLMLGWDLSCDRVDNAKDELVASLPGFKLNASGYDKTGRIDVFSFENDNLQLTSSIVGVEKTFFGAQMEMVENFSFHRKVSALVRF